MWYLYLIISWVLGQAAYTAINVWRLQRNLPIGYWESMKAYCKKEIGGYVVSGIAMLIVIFILPEVMNLQMTRHDLMTKTEKTLVEKAQIWFRITNIILSALSLHIMYALYKGGRKAIENAARVKGIDISDIDKTEQ